MFRKLRSFARYSLSVITRFFVMPPGPYPEYPSQMTDIDAYCRKIRDGYIASDSDSLMDEFQLARLNLCKTNSNVQHEYVTLKVTDPIEDSFHISMERILGDAIVPEKRGNDLATPQPPPSTKPRSLVEYSTREQNSSTESLADSSKKFTHHALDVVFPITPGMETRSPGDSIVYTVDFTLPRTASTSSTSASPGASRPSLYEVAVLGLLIHNENQKYCLMKENCYFYAGTILHFLAFKYHAEIQRVAKAPTRVEAGKFRGFTIFKPAEAGFGELSARLDTYIKDFMEPILKQRRLKAGLDNERREKENERREKESERREKENERREKEKERQEKEEERRLKENERREKEEERRLKEEAIQKLLERDARIAYLESLLAQHAGGSEVQSPPAS